MKLKDWLLNSETISHIPDDISFILAGQIYDVFSEVIENWYENPLGWYTLSSPYDAYVSFRDAISENPPDLAVIMSDWWIERGHGTKTRGELITSEIHEYYRKHQNTSPVNAIPNYDKESFGNLFVGEKLPMPKWNFEDFFNSLTRTRVWYENLSRTKNFPYTLSKKRISKRLRKNRYFTKLNMVTKISHFLEFHNFDGQGWREYIINLAISKLTKED